MLGGIAAIANPREIVVGSSGPDPTSDSARPMPDYYSKERSKQTGYAALIVGLGACAAGFMMKGFKTPDPHDNSA
jgi:hypothetical protein